MAWTLLVNLITKVVQDLVAQINRVLSAFFLCVYIG